jgi:hypothetical protein
MISTSNYPDSTINSGGGVFEVKEIALHESPPKNRVKITGASFFENEIH